MFNQLQYVLCMQAPIPMVITKGTALLTDEKTCFTPTGYYNGHLFITDWDGPVKYWYKVDQYVMLKAKAAFVADLVVVEIITSTRIIPTKVSSQEVLDFEGAKPLGVVR